MEFFVKINDFIVNLIQSLGSYGVLFSCLLIVVESVLPVLPLSVFVTMIFLYYGPLLGCVISYVFSVIGCCISFFLFQTVFKKKVDEHLRNKPAFEKFLKVIDNISFGKLAVLIAIPFTPAFIVNIAAGVSRMKFKKFFGAVLIGKVSLVYFWGYVGMSLVESLKDPVALIKVGVIIVVTYVISVIINKKFNLN